MPRLPAAAKVPQSLTSHEAGGAEVDEADGGPRRRQPGRPAAGGLEAFLKHSHLLERFWNQTKAIF